MRILPLQLHAAAGRGCAHAASSTRPLLTGIGFILGCVLPIVSLTLYWMPWEGSWVVVESVGLHANGSSGTVHSNWAGLAVGCRASFCPCRGFLGLEGSSGGRE